MLLLLLVEMVHDVEERVCVVGIVVEIECVVDLTVVVVAAVAAAAAAAAGIGVR